MGSTENFGAAAFSRFSDGTADGAQSGNRFGTYLHGLFDSSAMVTALTGWLASRKEISLPELADYPCVTFDQSDDSSFYLTEEAMADYDFPRLIKSDDRATTMEIIAALHGYSIGSGMLSGNDAILKGLVSIKLKEEDPLIIGYITRKGSLLSSYGRVYRSELLKYRELM